MASERLNKLASVRLVHLDRRVGRGGRANSREELATVTEPALLAGLDGDVPVGPHVFHEEVHEPQLVLKADDEVEARGMEGNTVGLLIEELAEVARLLDVVPHAHGLVHATSHHQGLPRADVHPQDCPGVESRQDRLKRRGLLRLEQVLAQQRQLVQLGRRRGHGEDLLRGAQRQAPDAGGAHGLQRDALDLLVDLLGVVALLVDAYVAVVAADDEALRESDRAGRRASDVRRAVQYLLELAGAAAELQGPALAAHEHPLVREPGVAQKALRLSWGRGHRLELVALPQLEEAKDAVPDDADDGGVRGVEGALTDRRVVGRDLQPGHGPRLVPHPVDERPVVVAAQGGPRHRQQELVVRREGHGDKLRAIDGLALGHDGERLPLLPSHQVENRHDGALLALLGHGEVLLGGVHRQTGDAVRALVAVEELLLPLLREQHRARPGGVDDLRLFGVVHIRPHVRLQPEHVPVRKSDGRRVGCGVRHS
mmetsp:Transcript_78047/g.221291  ORF Transcript_78047/g.221291 Transcript_78047/m.221291 type:complete len:483 (-) Transcript_78047:124-1572(-)